MQGSGSQGNREFRSWAMRGGPDPAQVSLRRWSWSRNGKAGNLQEAGSILDRMSRYEWHHGLGCSRWDEEGELKGEEAGKARPQRAQSGG